MDRNQANPMHGSMAARAWWAWQCLPRDPRGNAPQFRPLERKHGLSNNTLRKLMGAELRRPSYEVLTNAAAALGCSPEWLQHGKGTAPVATYPVAPWPGPSKKISSSPGTALPREAVRDFRENAPGKLSDRPAPARRRNASK